MRILVGYATLHGPARRIAERVADRLEAEGHEVDCRALREVREVSGYDAAVLGSAIHDQAWRPEALSFLAWAAKPLSTRPVWLFSVDPPATVPRRFEGWAMQREPMLHASIERAMRPRGHYLFAGGSVPERSPVSGPHGRDPAGPAGARFEDEAAVEAFAGVVAAGLEVARR